MRSWETKDITDILIKHHKELHEASVELGDGGDHKGATEIDDDCLVIENYLEEKFGIEWDGLKFLGKKVCKS